MTVRVIAVGAALVALLAGCTSSGTGGSGSGSGSGTSAPPSTGSSSSSTPAGSGSTATSTTTASTTATATASGTPSQPAQPSSTHRVAPRLTDFSAASLTWIGDSGWALGMANCLSGHGRCDAVEHTINGGRSWASLPAPVGAHVLVPDAQGNTDQASCSEPCLTGVRFASTRFGYAYGVKAFYTTADGGLSWHRRAGGAVALEAADGNVIRVTSPSSGCPGPCSIAFQTAPVGGSTWTTRLHAGNLSTFGVGFGRTGARAYLLLEGHVAGGGEHAYSTLYRTADDGRTWTQRGEPCPQLGREDDSTLPSSAPDGSLAVFCTPRGINANSFVATSTDGGRTFHAGSYQLGSGYTRALGAASSRTLVLSSDETYRSTDGGNHFTRLSANAGSSPGQLGWLGFSTTSVGHGISADRSSVWTTRDGGRTWTAFRFH